jgi:hypothetical protein
MVFDNNNVLLSVTVVRLSGCESPKSGRTIQPTNQPTNFLLNMASPIYVGSFSYYMALSNRGHSMSVRSNRCHIYIQVVMDIIVIWVIPSVLPILVERRFLTILFVRVNSLLPTKIYIVNYSGLYLSVNLTFNWILLKLHYPLWWCLFLCDIHLIVWSIFLKNHGSRRFTM